MKSASTLSVLRDVIRRNRLLVSGLLAVVIVVILLSLIPPQLLRIIIDRHLTRKETDGLGRLAFAYLGVLVLTGVFDFLKGSLLTILGQKIVRSLRTLMAEKLERLPAPYFTEHAAGEISSRFISDVENINSLFAEGLVSMIIDCFKIVGIVISIWLFSARLGLLTLTLIPFIAVFTSLFKKHMLRAQISNLGQLARVNAHISETLRNFFVIKVFGREAFMEEAYHKRLEDNFHTIERVNFLDSCYSPIIQITRAVVISVIIILSSSKLNKLGISLGMVAASIELISNLFKPIETLGTEFQNVQKGISGFNRIDSFCSEAEEDPKNGTLTLPDILPDGRKAGLSFESVCFSYEEGEPVLAEISLQIAAESNVLFAGRTGVGKTTLFRLVLGLLKPDSGAIRLNGVDVCTIPNQLKRSLFGYVEQQFSFIPGSIAEQITLNDPSIGPEAVIKAAEFVGLHQTILDFDQGYDTPADETLFSQGQKQLLSIARAIVADPPLLLLDEIAANLDTVTEERIISILQKAGSGRTVLSISHRMTASELCDMVVHIENGRIVSE